MRYSYHTSKNSAIKAIKKQQTHTASRHTSKAFLLSVLLAVVAALALVVSNALQAQAAPQNNQFTWDPDTGTLTIGEDCAEQEIADYLYDHSATTNDLITIDVVASIDFSGDFRSGYISLKSFIVEKGATISFPQGCLNLFYHCEALEQVSAERFNLSNVEDIANMFCKCNALKSLNVEGWDTRNIKNAQGAFYGCSALTELNVSKWNTANMVKMDSMFSGCSELQSLNLANWDTSQVKDMSSMFMGCESLKVLDLSSFKTSNLVVMFTMLANDLNLETVKLPHFDTSKCTEAVEGLNPLQYVFAQADEKTEKVSSLHPIMVELSPIYKASPDIAASEESGMYPYPGGNYYAYINGKKVNDKADTIKNLLAPYAATDTTVIDFYLEGHEPPAPPEPPTPPTPTPDPDNPKPEEEQGWNFNESGGWYYVYDTEGHTYNDGWHWIEDAHYGNHWYYFKEDSFIKTNEWIWDDVYTAWYYVNSSGSMNVGSWNWINNAWYGFNWDGTMCKGWTFDHDYMNWFYCDPTSGAMYTNCWSFINGSWYGFWANGEMCRGWVWDSGYHAWFYCSPSDGHMYTNGWYTIDNKSYYFNASGKLV